MEEGKETKRKKVVSDRKYKNLMEDLQSAVEQSNDIELFKNQYVPASVAPANMSRTQNS